ncbi:MULTISPECIES: type II toxin-antitoxin system MqsA family antitoxin [unclassified Pseudomonas]|jgi:HTH-type transcriptional regulator/antitoxin MqsA|uniref:type II toxin-antitoxin system MqsA family antitoxin n=1 Tax=unclassified Pseudomonas TaxID=196821 RepID=UPI000D01CB83|nr:MULTISPECIES: type II toxin-antitoxin system MqsA family antitoxin [unclassified Pseudomonas]MDR2319627.1 type II toxin-antitoxin system MqsA family antitoxin [Pseudomonas sp.]PYG81178.1 HTH-type transcriptional regulator/antitoxin MqsA [Pseudomonas sp. RV120224-01c]PYG84453.1 HTH-type transcriptional regulator/antitoxin MqsA [Pseudomonas sp. RV120224-01b]
MKCPLCGGAELEAQSQGMPYQYKGESTVIPDVIGDYCSACGEVILTHDEATRISALMSAFERQVDDVGV